MMADEDRETLRRIRALRRIEDNPDKWPAAVHQAAVTKLDQVRKIYGV